VDWSCGLEAVELAGKVVVVAVGWSGGEDLARALGDRGATTVLVGPDADALGRLAASLDGRPAVFVSDGSAESTEALAAFVSEMFRPS
jgi:NADPH-dependent 2,4-dienoyl-CoA reductase/sulfur reductase-like enzyme